MKSKTKFLNLFRRIFTIPAFEKILVSILKRYKYKYRFLEKIIPPEYLYKKESWRCVKQIGINYKLDISDCVDHGVYYGYADAHIYLTLLTKIREANIILDIGANIGSTSLFYASLNSKARILAFEPYPDTVKKLVDNIQRNEFKNIRVYGIGLGEKSSKQIIAEYDEHNSGMNRIVVTTSAPHALVQIDTLDSRMKELNIDKIDFIKIDVEGYEYFVLEGGKQIITQSKPTMLIEVDDNYLRANGKSAKELILLLQSMGYTTIYNAEDIQCIGPNADFDNCHFDIIVK